MIEYDLTWQNSFIRTLSKTYLTINMHSIAWHIITFIRMRKRIRSNNWTQTQGKSWMCSWGENSSPRGTTGTQTRPWTEIYQDRTSVDENIYIQGVLASCLAAIVHLVLFQNVNKHDMTVKENIKYFFYWNIFWNRVKIERQAVGFFLPVEMTLSVEVAYKTVCTWELRYFRVEQGLPHGRCNSVKDTPTVSCIFHEGKENCCKNATYWIRIWVSLFWSNYKDKRRAKLTKILVLCLLRIITCVSIVQESHWQVRSGVWSVWGVWQVWL